MDLGLNTAETAKSSNLKWFPYEKGGDFRKWFGNLDFIVNWENDGLEIKNYTDPLTNRIRSHNYNGIYAFRPGITWSEISIADIGCRISDKGFMFDSSAGKGFTDLNLYYILALLNSKVAMLFLKVLAPTMHYKVGDILKIPLKETNDGLHSSIVGLSEHCRVISQQDWD